MFMLLGSHLLHVTDLRRKHFEQRLHARVGERLLLERRLLVGALGLRLGAGVRRLQRTPTALTTRRASVCTLATTIFRPLTCCASDSSHARFCSNMSRSVRCDGEKVNVTRSAGRRSSAPARRPCCRRRPSILRISASSASLRSDFAGSAAGARPGAGASGLVRTPDATAMAVPRRASMLAPESTPRRAQATASRAAGLSSGAAEPGALPVPAISSSIGTSFRR